jgi:hypothetical protein
VFPDQPRHEQRCSCQSLAHWLRRVLPRSYPPVIEAGLIVRWSRGELQPRQGVIPDLPREGTSQDEVMHRLRLLVAQKAPRVVL